MRSSGQRWMQRLLYPSSPPLFPARFSTTLHSVKRMASIKTTFLHFQTKAEPKPLVFEKFTGLPSHVCREHVLLCGEEWNQTAESSDVSAPAVGVDPHALMRVLPSPRSVCELLQGLIWLPWNGKSSSREYLCTTPWLSFMFCRAMACVRLGHLFILVRMSGVYSLGMKSPDSASFLILKDLPCKIQSLIRSDSPFCVLIGFRFFGGKGELKGCEGGETFQNLA